MGDFWDSRWPTVLGVVLFAGAAVLLWPDRGPSVGAEPSAPALAVAPTVPVNTAAQFRTDQEVERRHDLEAAEQRALLRRAEGERERMLEPALDSSAEPARGGAGDQVRPVKLTEDSPEVRRALGQVEVELYETSWCQYCKKTRAFLDRSGVRYRAYDVEADSSAERRKDELAPGKGVPLTVVDGQLISGFSESALNSAFQVAVGQRLSAR